MHLRRIFSFWWPLFVGKMVMAIILTAKPCGPPAPRIFDPGKAAFSLSCRGRCRHCTQAGETERKRSLSLPVEPNKKKRILLESRSYGVASGQAWTGRSRSRARGRARAEPGQAQRRPRAGSGQPRKAPERPKKSSTDKGVGQKYGQRAREAGAATKSRNMRH